MLTKMVLSLVLLLLSPAYATITSLEYYSSALCALQHPKFFIDKYTPANSLLDDKTCHQAPAKTMAMKMVNNIDPHCVVLAYADYSCTELVGAVPASGKCLAAAKAKIGSWKAFCNTTTTASSANADEKPEISYVPSELKRRSVARLPRIRQRVRNVNTTTISVPYTTSTLNVTATSSDNRTVVASSVANQISSGISAADANATTTPAATFPSAGAQLSSVISSGSALDGNLTSYVTFTGTVTASASNTVKATPSTALTTMTYSGTSGRNGSATLYIGGGTSSQMVVGDRVLFTAVVAGVVAVFLGAIVS